MSDLRPDDSWAEVKRLRGEAEKCARGAEDPRNELALILAANFDMMASTMAERLNKAGVK